ncbi:hypothetical conserved protein [Oceanobacillus iheyensis HTE831]|uniref:Hypothetical conserved protein n=1 Tax=Oceanobacillus iheyensis (strain DSM 14371 / CIP 107618 / JCM 11309 / KCTC 3954 / HTE831) TaxID=221109 RepID=Q8ESV1_OCEIH|nr:hypothetical conserved protein [Oceanobacillus iheyensis HTE831]
MRNFAKLVNFEFRRFLPIFLALSGVLIVVQIIGVFIVSNSYKNNLEINYISGLMDKSEYISQYGLISMHQITNNIFFLGAIALVVVSLLIYLLFIWYRDWFGKNTFVYRLLMLPTNRMNIFFSKASSILIFIFGFVVLQILMIPMLHFILELLVPIDFRLDLSLTDIILGNQALSLFVPTYYVDFIIYYVIGIISMFVIFTMILMERSFRLLGFGMVIVYGGLIILLLISPDILQVLTNDYFYWMEVQIMRGALLILIGGLSLWLSNYLLNKKIRV